jgi:hypothetical protein
VAGWEEVQLPGKPIAPGNRLSPSGHEAGSDRLGTASSRRAGRPGRGGGPRRSRCRR